MRKYKPGTRNVTTCNICRPPAFCAEEVDDEVTSEQVTHLGFRSLESITCNNG